MDVTLNQHQHCSNCGGDMGFPMKWGFPQRKILECFNCGLREPVFQPTLTSPIYVVLISGTYASEINGKLETYSKSAMVAAYWDRRDADALVASAPTIGPNWKVAAMWVDTVVPGNKPFLN